MGGWGFAEADRAAWAIGLGVGDVLGVTAGALETTYAEASMCASSVRERTLSLR
jgi:hypothetical protein